MKITQTNKFRIFIDNPFHKKGSVLINNMIGGVNYSDYPQFCKRLYEFEDGTLVALGDTVFRINHKTFDKEVKAVLFSEAHLDGSVELFPTRELAEEKLKEMKENSEAIVKESDLRSNMLTIKVLSETKDFDSLTLKEIKRKLENINKLAEVWK